MFKGFISGPRYFFEMISTANFYNESLSRASENPLVMDHIIARRYAASASAVTGLIFYDMSLHKIKKNERELIGKISSKIFLLGDNTDFVIDEKQLTLEEKFVFLNNVKSNLFGISNISSNNKYEEASYALASSIYSTFLRNRNYNGLERISDNLMNAIKQQFIEENESELIELTKTIGASCFDSLAILPEILDGKDRFSIRQSARKLGEYSQFLDHYFEIDDDLKFGLHTYPTIKIKKEGDNPFIRNKIKKEMLNLANKSYEEGLSVLEEKDKFSYNFIKQFIDLKLKFLDRVPRIHF